MADFQFPDLTQIPPALLDKLEEYEKQVIEDKIMGHGLRVAQQAMTLGGRQPILGLDPLSKIVGELGPTGADADAATQQGLVGKEWVDAAYKNDPWKRLSATMVLDPTNLVGFGLPLKAAALATKIPKIGKALGTGLRAANVVDQLPGQVIGKGISTAQDIGRAGLQKAFDVAAPHMPTSPQAQAVGNALGRGNELWREQALISGGYPAANYTGNAWLAAQAGQMDVLKAALMAPFTGRSKRVDTYLKNIGNNRPKLTYPPGGTPPPIDPAAYNSRWGDEMARLGREPNVNNPLSTPSVLRDIPDTWGPANKVRDLAAGGSEKFKRFNQNRIEGPGVDAAFLKGFEPEFKRNANEFYKKLMSIKDPAGNVVPWAKDAADALRAAKGQMSPDDLKEIFYPGARARRAARIASGVPFTPKAPTSGASMSLQDLLIKDWEDRMISSIRAGTKNSTDIFFDYTANNPVDKLGRAAFAFHRFPINNIPKSMAAAAKRPVFGNLPVEWYRVSDEYNEDKGLPRRFHGEYPIGGLMEDGTQAFFDPMQWSPLGSLIKPMSRPQSDFDEQGTLLGEGADDLRGIGLGLNPFIDALLTVTGQHGRSFAPSFLRASQPINAAASAIADRPVDIEGFPKEILGNVQEELTGQRPFPYQEYLLRKRQAELKAFGKDSNYAGEQVGNVMAIEGLGGFAGIPGLKLLLPEEASIRRNAALAKAYQVAGNEPAYRANPTARAYADLDPRDEQIRQWDKLSADERQRLFRDPEVRVELTKEWNWVKLSASEREQLLRDPEMREPLLDRLSGQLHNSPTSNGRPNPTGNPLIGSARVGRTPTPAITPPRAPTPTVPAMERNR